MRFTRKCLVFIGLCILLGTTKVMSDILYKSEWTNPDGSKSASTVTFYNNTGLKGMMGYYSGSQRNRMIGRYNSDKTVFYG